MNRSNNNLNHLSKADLKHCLIQFGFPNMPLKETTKPILVKKLQNCLNTEKDKLDEATKYVAQYSSDEESVDITNKEKIRANSLFNKTNTSFSKNMPSKLDLFSKRSTSSFYSPLKCQTNNYCIKGQQKVETQTQGVDKFSFRTVPTGDFIGCKYAMSSRSNTISPKLYNDRSYETEELKLDNSFELYPKCDLNGDYSCTTNYNAKYSSACVSNFTRRLLNLRTETLKNNNVLNQSELQSKKNIYIINNQKNVRNRPEKTLDKRSIDVLISPSTAFSNLLSKLDEQFSSKQTAVPYILTGLLTVFLFLLAIMYLTITPDLESTVNEKSTRYNYCASEVSESLQFSSLYCIERGHLHNALEIIKLIIPLLQHRAEEHHCISHTKPFTVGANEALNLMRETVKINSMGEAIKDVQNAEYLIEKNPQWNIHNVDLNGKILNFESVVRINSFQGIYFALLNPQLPLFCSMYNKTQKLFCIVGVVGIFALVAGSIYTVYNVVKIYYKSKRDIINYFIEETINIVINTATDTNQNSINVNHLRDKIIPLHKRKKLEWAWEQAIKYLQENESRLQFEMKIINGEDCKIIKWTDTIPTERVSQSKTCKKWQSPAFDNTNKIINPPTSCLKIRQMFDKFEACDPNLKTIIQDAILEKVGGKCKIYDIQLDKQTCCVYVRCASEKDAGFVHNEINGWWFDKRLVSIKFLRVERYISRFIDSSNGPAYLFPSNSKNLSMTQCYKSFDAISNI